ncbi:hypothetical protein QJS10_CPB17g00842 [Acorus calamus]|uniref:Retrotransposon protein n=1 Tax=Acorus calamus TaxID=4465 RepID=A0AAV9CXE2_ACOCL|nr:hypothetical protein QJS10_CPB17g00842 [Acorus calamus]
MDETELGSPEMEGEEEKEMHQDQINETSMSPKVTIKRYWDIVKVDVVTMFEEFYAGNQSVGCLNASMFVLLPKKEGAESVEEFRPICMVNGGIHDRCQSLGQQIETGSEIS